MNKARPLAVRALARVGRALWALLRMLLLALFVVLALVIPIPMAPMFRIILKREGQTASQVTRKEER